MKTLIETDPSEPAMFRPDICASDDDGGIRDSIIYGMGRQSVGMSVAAPHTIQRIVELSEGIFAMVDVQTSY